MQEEITRLNKELNDLKNLFYADNFSSKQIFRKSSDFTTRLKVPVYASDPATCTIGELVTVDGKLKVCSATDTWSVVGEQTA